MQKNHKRIIKVVHMTVYSKFSEVIASQCNEQTIPYSLIIFPSSELSVTANK